jgi:hypothetical protein
MTTTHLKTWVETTPEKLYLSNMLQTVNTAQHNIGIKSRVSSLVIFSTIVAEKLPRVFTATNNLSWLLRDDFCSNHSAMDQAAGHWLVTA